MRRLTASRWRDFRVEFKIIPRALRLVGSRGLCGREDDCAIEELDGPVHARASLLTPLRALFSESIAHHP